MVPGESIRPVVARAAEDDCKMKSMQAGFSRIDPIAVRWRTS